MSFTENVRPTGKYCFLRLTKKVGRETWHTSRWVPAKIALQGKPIGFKVGDQWSDGWLFTNPGPVIERPRIHSSWDDRRVSPETN